MMKRIIFAVFGAGLVACSSVSTLSVEATTIAVETLSDGGQNRADSMIAPYRSELALEMNEVIAYAEKNFEKGRPSGSLNNWAADAALQSQIRNARLSAPTFCLLNTGGLRNTINAGDVTLGDIFKVMPFDNEIVWVEMPVDALKDVEMYLKATGGEPIAGARMIKGKLVVDGVSEQTNTVWIITSDYLMNGGDNMAFFSKKESVSYANVLLRDALIDEARRQGTLIYNDENRIEIE